MKLRKLFTRRRICWLLVLAFVGVNTAAFLFARKMLVFAEGSTMTTAKYSFGTLLAIVFEGVPKPKNFYTPAHLGLAFTTTVLRAEGKLDLEAWQIPHANPRATVALFHGHCAAKSHVLPAAKIFHELGCEVWLLDFYGSGGSGGNATSIGWFEADDVSRMHGHLKSSAAPRPVLLYGISMGGAAVARAVGELGVVPDGVILEATYNRLRSTIAHRIEAVGCPGSPLAEIITFWGGVQLGVNSFQLNPADYAKRISAPTLLLQGARDTMVRPAEAKEIFDNLAGPKKFVSFGNAQHEDLFRHDPEKWRTEISAWLDEAIAHARR